jgi:hypothetical protein
LLLANGGLNVEIICNYLIVNDFIFVVVAISAIETLFGQLAPYPWIANITLAYRMYAG